MRLLSKLGHGFAVMAIAAMASAASAQPLRDVSIALGSATFPSAPAKIADELGLYEKHGIKPKFTTMESAAAATSALISRSVDAAVSGPGEVVVAQSRGQKVVVLAYISAGLTGTVVISSKAAAKLNVSPTASVADRLKALDGLVLGAPSATGAYTIAIRGAARDAGAKPRFAYMAATALPAALQTDAIQGFISGAPFWGISVANGMGVVWLSGPKGEFPPDNTPASTVNLQMMRDYAEAHPDIAKSLVAVFADLAEAIDKRPAEVKAAIGKIYPNLDAGMIDLLYSGESLAWKTKPPTTADIGREIAFVKSSGEQLPLIDTISPAALLYP
jgi:ABC-type nitrate/sulfonate/bicarbonate transport system substrate-binding protein